METIFGYFLVGFLWFYAIFLNAQQKGDTVKPELEEGKIYKVGVGFCLTEIAFSLLDVIVLTKEDFVLILGWKKLSGNTVKMLILSGPHKGKTGFRDLTTATIFLKAIET